ncbi:Cysteine-rich repeat secretory protein 9 [Cardamine amara subsp. amara]|uniref:Cysteine-rich repeat secretory protein 9 n=1 Tax=Cardamine amara subsp. amara TaxID=228776 RepID=A0ABD0ZBF3_CARAN
MARIMITFTASLFFFSLLSHQTMSQPEHMFTFCNPTNTFTQTSLYEANRIILLSALTDIASLIPFSNITLGLSPDTINGMFLCRGDINAKSCSECVQTAAIEIATNCTLNKRAVIYYNECMVRYSDVSFFSELEVTPSITIFSQLSAPNLNRFNETLTSKFNQLILSTSLSSSIPYFVQDQEVVTQPEGSYELDSMVQCTPDLDPSNCTACLKLAFFRVSTCCGLTSFSQIFTPKCLLMYKTSVLISPTSSPSPSPQSPPVPSPF